MNKLEVEVGLNTKGVEDDLISLRELIANTEEEIGRELTADEKATVEEMYWDIYGKTKRLGNSIEKTIDESTKGIKRTVKGITRMGLAIFGIRSAFMLVRSAMSTITSQDEQLKADIDYMKNALAYSLEPLIRKIVDWAKQLLFYLAYILKAWSNGKIDIFKGANKGLEKANKGAKELSKTMAGFDEMNVVNDSGGGGGSASPSFNLSDMEGEVPGWLQWIADNGQLVIGIITGIATALALVKFGLDIIMAIGIGAIVAGVVMLIMDIIDMIKDPSWENFVAILGDIAVVIGGIMLLMGNWWGLLLVILGLIVKYVAENWDKIKEILGKVWDWINEKIIQPVAKLFSGLWDKVKEGAKNSWEKTKEFFSPMVNFFSGIINKIIGFFKNVGTKVGDALGGSFKGVINGVLGAIERILNYPIRQINNLLDIINSVPGVNISRLSTFSLPRLAKGGIVNMPGRGVPIGGATVAERAPEGVIPLTDSQQMALLGEAIGRFVNINATVPVYVGNRLVLREMKRIEAEDNFAYNR